MTFGDLCRGYSIKKTGGGRKWPFSVREGSQEKVSEGGNILGKMSEGVKLSK